MTIINTTTRSTSSTIRNNQQPQQRQQQAGPSYQSIDQSNLTYIRGGDINQSTAKTWLVGVNTTGNLAEFTTSVAGTVARKFREVVPIYQQACQDEKLKPGGAMKARTRNGLNLVLLAIWHIQIFGSRLEWVISSLSLLSKIVAGGKYQIESLATVKLGCGGPKGLNWEEVGPEQAWYLAQLDCPVEVYIGKGDKAYFPVQQADDTWTVIGLDAAAMDEKAVAEAVLSFTEVLD